MLIIGTAISMIHLRTVLKQEWESRYRTVLLFLSCCQDITLLTVPPLPLCLGIGPLLSVNGFSSLLFPWGWLACFVFMDSLLCHSPRQKSNPVPPHWWICWCTGPALNLGGYLAEIPSSHGLSYLALHWDPKFTPSATWTSWGHHFPASSTGCRLHCAPWDPSKPSCLLSYDDFPCPQWYLFKKKVLLLVINEYICYRTNTKEKPSLHNEICICSSQRW